MILDKIDKNLLKLAEESDIELKEKYDEVDKISFYNSNRILSAFIENNVSYSDFAEMNGYGDYDEGRNKLVHIWVQEQASDDPSQYYLKYEFDRKLDKNRTYESREFFPVLSREDYP